jgi:hypothetical protein
MAKDSLEDYVIATSVILQPIPSIPILRPTAGAPGNPHSLERRPRKGLAFWNIERCAAAQPLHRIGIGDVQPPERDQIRAIVLARQDA